MASYSHVDLGWCSGINIQHWCSAQCSGQLYKCNMDNDISSVHYCVYAEYMTNTLWIYSLHRSHRSLVRIVRRKIFNIYLCTIVFVTISCQLLCVTIHPWHQFCVPSSSLVAPASGTLTMTKISDWTKKPPLFPASTHSRQKGTDMFWNQTNSIAKKRFLFVGLQSSDQDTTHGITGIRVLEILPMSWIYILWSSRRYPLADKW